ncbi:MAG: hypothetical protein Q8P39_00545 [Candidatus Yanofskybacteria bacterium]|nr:hypothetical protein [Candidatus Yanofskybacteria bacterium]
MTVDFFQKRYGYEVEGVWMPRVTAITSLFSHMNQIPGISAYAEWGNEVHEGIAGILKGESMDPQSRIAPSLRAFSLWMHSISFETRKEDIERRVSDKHHRYAGTIDLFCSIDGKQGILDIKTGTEIRKEFFLQTAAYLNAYNQEMSGAQPAETRWILRVDQYKECLGCEAKLRSRARKPSIAGGNPFCNHQWGEAQGSTELKELEGYEHDLEAFFAAKEVWEWQHRDILRRVPGYPARMFQKMLI